METVHTYQPSHPLLKPVLSYIRIWRRDKTDTQAGLFLPHNSSGFGMTLSGSLMVKNHDNFETMPLIGTRDIFRNAKWVKTEGRFLNVSVSFIMPNGLHLFTKIPSDKIYGENAFSLCHMFKRQEIDDLTEQMLEACSDERKVSVLEDFLAAKIIHQSPLVFSHIIQYIHATKGVISLSYLSRNYKLSERTINRYFNKLVGINPTEYIHLIRFRSFIRQAGDSGNHESILSKALHAGFYDQSHFIRQFKKFSSVTPYRFFKGKENLSVSDFYNF